MKKNIFLLTALLLLGAMPVQSQSNLYVYKTDGSKETVSLDDLQKLTFTGTDLVINQVSGTPGSVAFSDLKFFSLKNFTTTGIAEVSKHEESVNVWSNNGIVTAKSAQPITGVTVFDLQGRKLLQLHPGSQEINLPLAAYPAGVYLVQVANETGITTKKIIKN
jgi:hypothetical protein